MVDLYYSCVKTDLATNIDLDSRRAKFSAGLRKIVPLGGRNRGTFVYLEIRLHFSSKPIIREGPEAMYSPAIKYLLSEVNPMHVDDFCASPTLIDWRGRLTREYRGRIRPIIANPQLFVKWKATCSSRHGENCINPEKGGQIHGLRFIDVQRRCIVDDNQGADYVALSYLWGKPTKPQSTLSTETAPRFFQPFSLTPVVLPATVDDAISVTAMIGERYLWVDRLCVKQDDDLDKANFIPQMHLIYGNACLTIVAAAGMDCEAGLPGVRLGTRAKVQQVVSFEGIPMMESLDPVYNSRRETEHPLSGTQYSRRGWCFQEKRLCYRALIFTAEQISWECQQATWCEEAFYESPDCAPLYLSDHSFRQPWGQISSIEFMNLYSNLVADYSRCQLSYTSDRLNAFQGCLQQLGNGFNQKFHWALPTKYFEDALAWTARYDIATRNTAKQIQVNANGGSSSVPLPSWSWVGWMGKIEFGDSVNFIERPQLLVFYKLDERSQPTKLILSGKEQQLRRLQIDQLDAPWLDVSRSSFSIDMIPEFILESPLALTIICFGTIVARVKVSYQPGTPKTNEQKAQNYLMDVEQEGELYAVENWQSTFLEPGFYESAVIRRDIYRREGLYEEVDLNILYLVWVEDIAYRVGLGSIKEKNWMKLRREWKSIILG